MYNSLFFSLLSCWIYFIYRLCDLFLTFNSFPVVLHWTHSIKCTEFVGFLPLWRKTITLESQTSTSRRFQETQPRAIKLKIRALPHNHTFKRQTDSTFTLSLYFTISRHLSVPFVYLISSSPPIVFLLKSPAEESISYQTMKTPRLAVFVFHAVSIAYHPTSVTVCAAFPVYMSNEILHLIDRASITHLHLLVCEESAIFNSSNGLIEQELNPGR